MSPTQTTTTSVSYSALNYLTLLNSKPTQLAILSNFLTEQLMSQQTNYANSTVLECSGSVDSQLPARRQQGCRAWSIVNDPKSRGPARFSADCFGRNAECVSSLAASLCVYFLAVAVCWSVRGDGASAWSLGGRGGYGEGYATCDWQSVVHDVSYAGLSALYHTIHACKRCAAVQAFQQYGRRCACAKCRRVQSCVQNGVGQGSFNSFASGSGFTASVEGTSLVEVETIERYFLRCLSVSSYLTQIYRRFLMVNGLRQMCEYMWDFEIVDRSYIQLCLDVYGTPDLSYETVLRPGNVVANDDFILAVRVRIGSLGVYVFAPDGPVSVPARRVESIVYNDSLVIVNLSVIRAVFQYDVVDNFVLARNSDYADVELNPGPETTMIVYNTVYSVSAVTFAWFILGPMTFSLWIICVFCCLRFFPLSTEKTTIGADKRHFIVPIFLAFAIFIQLYVDPYLYAAARDSTMHDIELNPGPVNWMDDIVAHSNQAILGLSLHQFDVRTVLVAHRQPLSTFEVEFQKLTSNSACAAYYKGTVAGSAQTLVDLPLLPAGVSDVAFAKAFRAVYMQYRTVYVQYLTTMYPPTVSGSLDTSGFPVHPDAVVNTGGGVLLRPVRERVTPEPMPYIKVEKVYCARCKCDVVPEGHEERCRIPSPALSSNDRNAAWIGDALHTLDIRIALVNAQIPLKKISACADLLKSAHAQQMYLLEVAPKHGVFVDKTISERTASTYFEAVYNKEFRKRYVEYLLSEVPTFVEEYGQQNYDPGVVMNEFELRVPIDFAMLL